MIGVYRILNTVNGKFYIGSSIDVENRWKGHIRELDKGIHNNQHLQNAWNKYGKESFVFELLEQVDDKEHLRERETFYLISSHCTNPDIGYNMLNDANIGLGVHASLEVRQKISQSCKGSKNGHYGKSHTDEVKASISRIKQEQGRIKREYNHQMWLKEEHRCEICGKIMKYKYGAGRFCDKRCLSKYMSSVHKNKPHTEEHNKKVSQALKGRTFTDQHKKKISDNAKRRMSSPENNPMYGRRHSEETKKHWSDIRKGMPSSCGFAGKHHSEETKKKISESVRRRNRLKGENSNDL